MFEYFVHFLQIGIPAYFANAAPTFLIKMRKHPIDFSMKWKGQRVLGDGKTIEGFILASIVAYLTGLLELQVIGNFSYEFLIIPPVGFLFIGVGAMIGDMVGSFIKRRMKMKRGEDAGLLDMLDFIIGAFISASFFTNFSVIVFIIALILTPLVHRAANIIGYTIGLKKEPW